MRILLSVVFFLMSFAGGYAQVLENYQSRVRVQSHVNWFKRNQVAQVTLDVGGFPGSSYLFQLPEGSTVFMDNKLWFYTPNDTVVEAPLKTLKEKFSLARATQADLTILHSHLDLSSIVVLKGYFENRDTQEAQVKIGGLVMEKRQRTSFDDFFIIALVIILTLLAVFKIVFPVVLALIAKPQMVFTAEDFSETGTLQKFFSIDVIFYLLLLNLCLTLTGMLAVKCLQVPLLDRFVSGDINSLFFNWFVGTLFLMGMSIGKFLLLKVMVSIFDLGKFEFAHFFYLLRIVSISVVAILLVSLYFYFNHQSFVEQVVKYSTVAFFWIYLLGVMLMYFIMAAKVPFKNYHLFAYICTAELIPFLILSRIVMG